MFKKYSNFMFWKKILEKVLQNYKYFDLKLMYFFEKNLFRNIDIASSPITLDNFFKNIKNMIKNYLQFAKKSNQNFKYWARNKSVCGAYKKSGNFCCVTIFENLFIQEERVRTIWEGGREGVKILHLKLLDIKRVYPYKILLIWFVILIFFISYYQYF